MPPTNIMRWLFGKTKEHLGLPFSLLSAEFCIATPSFLEEFDKALKSRPFIGQFVPVLVQKSKAVVVGAEIILGNLQGFPFFLPLLESIPLSTSLSLKRNHGGSIIAVVVAVVAVC